MSKSEYTLVLPAFTIGIHAYDAIGKITKHFGKKVVIIGGKTALSKAKQPLLDAIAKTDLEVLDVLWYGDDATFEHVDRLLKEKSRSRCRSCLRCRRRPGHRYGEGRCR